jgi:hypothetical protein
LKTIPSATSSNWNVVDERRVFRIGRALRH